MEREEGRRRERESERVGERVIERGREKKDQSFFFAIIRYQDESIPCLSFALAYHY